MHHVSTIYARLICRELSLSSEVADELLSDSALSYEAIFQQVLMPYADFFSFLRNVRAKYTQEDLGLRVGSKLTPPSLGELGNAMLCAPSMIEALQLSASFAQVHAAYYRLELIASEKGAKVQFIELADLGNTQQFQTEVMMQMVQNLIEAVIGTDFNEGCFSFPYPKPVNGDKYKTFFHSPCVFGHEHAALEIPMKFLKMNSPFYDPTAWQDYQLKLEKQLNKLSKDFNQRIDSRQYIEKVQNYLSTSSLPLPSAENAAEKFNMTSRTLSRHLRNEGTSFREIRNQLLKEYAEYYLTESDMTVDAIAFLLGYQDFSSFRRAFKQWFGCTPTEFRTLR